MIKILVAEDHAMMREGLRRIIDESIGMKTVGEAANGLEALEKICSVECDLIIMDMTMPGIGGVDLIRRIRQVRPRLPILVMSMHDTAKIVTAALKAGANGYITKNTAPDSLSGIIHIIARGDAYVDPVIASRVLTERGSDRQPHEMLSERESQLLHQIISGKPSKQIAAELFISPKTVSTHKKRIMEKMELNNSADLVRYALEHHLSGESLPDAVDQLQLFPLFR